MADSQHLPRRLAAVLYADVAGYSRLTAADEDATHRRLSAYLDLFAATVKAHGGKVKAHDWFDLSGVFDVNEQISITVGVNNLFDEEPPLTSSTVALNANSPGGYDQIGRYIFGQVNYRL